MSLNNAHEGYDYQDLLTSYFILKEILKGNNKTTFYIDKKHTVGTYNVTTRDKDGSEKVTVKSTPDRFDDLVIVNDSKIQRKQIKYSNDSVARKLIKNDFANDSKGLALYEIYRTWNELKSSSSEFRLCLAWDKPVDDDIKNVLIPIQSETSSFLDYPTKLFKINLDEIWENDSEPLSSWKNFRSFIIENSINRNDFKTFCDELIIELEFPKASLDFASPSYLENILYLQAEKLGVGQYPNNDVDINRFLIILAKKVGEYRAKSAEVTVENILKDLKIKTDFGKIEQKFEIDQTKNIKNIEKFSSFYDEAITNRKSLLIGEPGSGKSWFLTNFIDYLNDHSKKVIRHYCYTSTEDDLIEKRVSSDVFFGNLIANIIEEFPNLQEVKEKLFVSDLNELQLLLSCIEEDLVIIIDGLDHIDRVLKSSSTLAEDKTKIIEYISRINLPENISIILGSQPVDEIKILMQKFGFIEYKIPEWDINDTIKLMHKFSLDNMLLKDKSLSEYIFEKSEGNPLYLTYIIKTLISEEISLETFNKLPAYDFNLEKYYQYLTEQIGDNLTSETLSCLDFSVTRQELSEIIPRSNHLENNLKVLFPVIVENVSRGGIKLYHDSFRRFNIKKLESNANLDEIYKDIAKWLKQQHFYKNAKSYRYLLKYYIKLKNYTNVKKYATNDFLTKSLYHGYSEGIIKTNYDNFLYVARETLDWSLYVYISELNRTIYTTISDDYNSEFLERFELYFEAVGLIYGFEKSNEMLFFDGEANFSNEIIAKAFYISQRNGFVPRWNLLEGYFKDEIPLKDYKYYISERIALNNDLNIEFNELLSGGYDDFLSIFIEEVYEQIGFIQILELYNKVKCVYKASVANKINRSLNKTNCVQRILVAKNPRKDLVLEELNLNFISGYIKKEELRNFYGLVRMYAVYNIEKLEKFEQSIPLENFFFNWLKFFIRNLIIESNINKAQYKSYAELENDIVENFEFLASDIDLFKGKPRVVDFKHENSDILNLSLEQGLKYIKTQDSWNKVFVFLKRIPFNTLSVVEKKYVNNENINLIINCYEEFDKSSELDYYEHLEYAFKKAIYYAKVDNKMVAKSELKKATYLLTSYTYRKDRTLSEIIEPLNIVNNIDHKFARKYAKKLKYLTDAVMKHTEDGKDIRWLTIEWFQKFLEVDYKLSSMYLIYQLLNNDFYWKHEYMFVDYLKISQKVNPIILNFLYLTSPTNSKDNYINHFADNIYRIKNVDKSLARQSLVNILSRDINSSNEKLKSNTIKKLHVLKNTLNVAIPITTEQKKDNTSWSYKKDTELIDKLNKDFQTVFFILEDKSLDEINEYFEKKDKLTDGDLNRIYFYLLQQDNNDSMVIDILIPIIKKRFPRDEEYFEKLNQLINFLNIDNSTKIFLLVNNFLYSKNGWFSQFVYKESLKDAVAINKEDTINILAECLLNIFSNLGYGSKSTANLIIAFEYAGIHEEVLSMYKTGFEQIEYRLPDENDFKWKNIKDKDINNMSHDAIAIVMLLCRLKNLDSYIQQEVIFAINYLINFDESLLVEPLKWFFKNCHYFPQLSLSALLEVLSLYAENKHDFLKNIIEDITSISTIENRYIQNSITLLFDRFKNV